MEYATQYYIGHHPTAQNPKTKKIVQSVGRVQGMDAKDKRRTRNKQGQTQVSSDTNAANGFLKTTFLPKLEAMEIVQSPAEMRKIETHFYQSLCAVATHYQGLELTDTRTFGYPYNIALSIWEVRNYLKHSVSSWHSLQLVCLDSGKTVLVTEERFNTGTTLYYIPVIPLFKILKDKNKKRVVPLLLSVFAYLYHIADIPYYRQENTYMYYEYQMISEWVEQDDEYEDRCKKDLQFADWVGDRVEQKIFNRKNLDVFADRINTFKPKNQFEQECYQVAKETFALYSCYPKATIFLHAKYSGEDMDTEEIIRMDQYVSFVADTKGWQYDMLAECVNNEFNECGEIEEPAIVKMFDGTALTNCNLDFENRLFPLIDDLCYLLNNYEKEMS